MTRRTFYPDRFLQAVYWTEPFREYCLSRGILFEREAGGECRPEDLARWQEALARLPAEAQADVELELTQVNDIANDESIRHLVEVCAGRRLPPDTVPGEEAQALWFLLHEPEAFREVYFNEEVREIESWRNASAEPGLAVESDRSAFERAMSDFFRSCEGSGRFCASQAYRFSDPDCHVIIASVSDRLRFLETFTDAGEHRRQRVRPACRVIFAYYPADGTVLLKSRHRSRERVGELLRAFAATILGAGIDEDSLGFSFDLDRLRTRFDPPLPEDVTSVRVKALELAYPAAEGRRRIRLETNASDDRFAILELLREHVGREGQLSRLRVVHAELQVRLYVRGRMKSHFIRLWSNRCSLNQTPTAEALRRCLQTWGLYRDHASRP